MNKLHDFSLVYFSVDHPRWVVAVTLFITLAALAAFPKVRTDINPKNMLPADSAVRVSNDAVEKTFGLYEDMIVVGVTQETGVLNAGTLGKIKRISDELLNIPGVAARDVAGFATIDNVTAGDGTLQVEPLMSEAPSDTPSLEKLRGQLFGNPMFIGRIISQDGKTAAIYIPLEKGANGKAVADKVREIVKLEGGPEQYYIAGDPVARDTFGAEMFKLMAIFAPMAGLLMFAARYLMFGDLFLSAALMMDAMIATVWSMGLLIALGYPIHIMSSMAPVFLMAIATDSIHIFNEFYFRYREEQDKKTAILKTMDAVGRPVRYTALATAAGFSVLLFMNIVPVKIFGGLVAFGTVLLRILSFSFIPAMFTFVKESSIEKASQGEEIGSSRISRFLAGYQRTPWTDFTAGLQYYGEYMHRYSCYTAALPAGFPKQDRLRQLLTLRLTQFLKYQIWKLSMFSFWSPTDQDFYLIPEAAWRATDELTATVGANILGGASRSTFLGQLDKNDNLYISLRYEL